MSLFVSYRVMHPALSIDGGFNDIVLDMGPPQSTADIKSMKSEIGRRFVADNMLDNAVTRNYPVWVTILFWQQI